MDMKQNTKTRLLKAGCTIFAKNGFNQATIADISTKAEANIASVNYHFQSKENLYQEVLKYAISYTKKNFPLNKDVDESSDGRYKLKAFIEGLVSRVYSEKPKNYLKSIMSWEVVSPTENNFLIGEYLQEIKNELVNIIDSLSKNIKTSEKQDFFVYSIFSQIFFYEQVKNTEFVPMEKNIKNCIDPLHLARQIYDFVIGAIENNK